MKGSENASEISSCLAERSDLRVLPRGNLEACFPNGRAEGRSHRCEFLARLLRKFFGIQHRDYLVTYEARHASL